MDPRSEKNLVGVNEHLVDVVRRTKELMDLNTVPFSFVVTEGLRTKERQAELLKAGATRTMNSRHLTGHAVDLAVKVGDAIRWDWPLYDQLAQWVKLAAAEMDTKIVWGGDWKTFKDGPHFELDRETYGA